MSDAPHRDGSTPVADADFEGPTVRALGDRPTIPLREHHPTGLYLLFGVEMWERFSFYGMRAILPLYLAAALLVGGDDKRGPGRGWTQGEASILMGWYGGMCYLLPIIGGLLADKLIGTHRSMLIGGLLIAAGHIVLGLSGIGGLATNASGLSAFIGGLALITIGTGYFKPCVSVMVGQLYRQGDPLRDSAFAIFYLGINVGAFLGQTVCGLAAQELGWHYGFGAAAVGMLAGLGMYVFMRPTYLAGVGEAPRIDASGIAFLLLLGGAGLAALFGWLHFSGALSRVMAGIGDFNTQQPLLANGLMFAVVTAVLLGTVWFVMIQKEGDKGPTACIFIFMAFNAVFWLGFEQAATSLNFFAERRTDLTMGGLFGGWSIPPAWLQNVNPALIVLLSPFFAWMWAWLAKHNHEISQPVKIALGLIFLAIGYGFITLGASVASDTVKVTVFWLIALYFWHTVGELFLSPTGLSFVTKTAPVRFVSLLMGVWFISSFLAHLIGGYVASYVEDIEKGKIALPWHFGGQADFYFFFVVAAAAAGVAILILTPLFKRMLARPERPPLRGFPVGEVDREQ